MRETTLTATLVSPRGLAVAHWWSGEVSMTEEDGWAGGPQPVRRGMVQVDISMLQRGGEGREEEGGKG